MAESRKQIAEREEIRLALAAILMHAEISALRMPIDSWPSNEDLADRGLRRADMLMQKHKQSSEGATK